jgi:hypothetical protein
LVKWSLRILIILILSSAVSYFPLNISDDVFSELYMIIGIMFPIALSQIMAFSFGEIENDTFVKRYRDQLKIIRGVFIILFIVSTIIFLIKSERHCFQLKFLRFDNQCLYIVFYIFCLYYYIRNFISLVQLKDEIEDELRNYHKKVTGKNDDVS